MRVIICPPPIQSDLQSNIGVFPERGKHFMEIDVVLLCVVSVL